MVGVFVLGLLVSSDEFAPGVIASVPHFFLYLGAQLVGAALGALGTFLAYKKHFDAETDAATKLGVFATDPALRSYGWNLVTEALGTFVLVYVVLFFGQTPSGLGPLAVAMLVVGIGASLGGPTGYAINPARDLGPRVVHALLRLNRRHGSAWGYAWVPVLGPLLGGLVAGGLYGLVTAV